VYGWYTGLADGRLASSYFVLENYYTPAEAGFVAVAEADLHSGWTQDEARCHELARLQDAFVREWLVYGAQPEALPQLDEYARAELAAGDVMVRFERLGKFSKLQPNWTYYSPHFESGVLQALSKRWPLDYRG
jgi:hypothetical protein